MSAQWIGNGDPVPSVPLKLPAPPYREWHVAGLTFRRSRRQGRWACETDSCGLKRCGIAGARTPFGALFTVLRMLREG